jgi:plastocyanin
MIVSVSCAMTVLISAKLHLQAAIPRPQPSCVPQEDRVGFPEGFRDYPLLYTLDREENRIVFYVYGNDQAAGTKPGEPFPYGSVIVLDGYHAVLDDSGEPVQDENGRYIPGDHAVGPGVMRKEEGFGTDYCENQAGEWEFVGYKEDGSYDTPPQASWTCARCHQFAGAVQPTGAVTDYVFRMNLSYAHANGAVPTAVMQNVKFLPRTLEVTAGTTVTWYNDDRERHSLVSDDGSFDPSGVIWPGSTFSQKFSEPGEYSYRCAIHPGMRHGKVIVTGK